jgi:AcrR family transcriptional regulator
MSSVSDLGLKRILVAASTLFGRNGFQRTSMSDIAREAGIARATLYLRFSDKRAVFEALAVSLVDEALMRAEQAWDVDASLSKNLAETILAKEVMFFRMLRDTPHGAELMDIQADITSTQAQRLNDAYEALLVRRGSEAAKSGADLAAFDGAEGFAAFLVMVGSGLKYEARTEDALRRGIERVAKVSARAASQS